MSENESRRLTDRLFNLAWLALGGVAVLLALYVVAASQLLSLAAERRADIAAWTGARIGMSVEVDGISGRMHRLFPEFRLRGVRIGLEPGGEPALRAATVEARLDPLASLLAWRPVLRRLSVDGLEVSLVPGEDGGLRVKGFPFRIDDPLAGERLEQALEVFYRQRYIAVSRARVLMEDETALPLPLREVSIASLRIQNDGDVHRVAGELTAVGPGRLPVAFRMQFSGAPVTPAEFAADLHVRLQTSSLEGWLQRRDLAGLWLDSVSAGGEAWLRLEGLRVSRALGLAHIDSVALSREDGAKVGGLFGFRTRFSVERLDDGWRLALAGLDVNRHGVQWPETDAALEWRRDEEDRLKVRAMLARGSVGMLSAFSDLLPEEQVAVRERLAAMEPRGRLSRVDLRWDEAAPEDDRGWLSVDFAQVALRPAGNWPGGEGWSGRLEVRPREGLLRLRGREATLEWPTLFAGKIPLDAADAKVHWARDEQGGWLVQSAPIAFSNADARADASFVLEMPAADSAVSPRLRLSGLLRDGNVAATARYLPLSLSEGLRDWLTRALAGGRLERGSFLFDGPVARDAQSLARRTFQMRFEGSDTTLAFLPGWPSLTRADADVLIEDGHVRARGRAGRLLETQLAGIDVTLTPRPPAPSRLRVNLRADGELADLFTLFRETPLKPAIPAGLLDWNGEGRLSATIGVESVIGGEEPVKVMATGRADGATLSSTVHRLEISDVSGVLAFDTEQGFSARELRGRALGSDFTGDARTIRVSGEPQTRIALQGRLRTGPVNQWLRIPALDVLRGDADASLVLAFGAMGKASGALEVRSDLRGIASTAPAPLSKSAGTAVDTRLTLELGAVEPRFTFASGRALATDLVLRDGAPVSGTVLLGSAKPQRTTGPGLVIEGDLPRLVLDDWSRFIALLAGTPPPENGTKGSLAAAIAGIAAAGERLQRVNITAGELDAGLMRLEAARLRLSRQEAGWLARVDSRALRGQILLPDGYTPQGEKPLVVQVEQLVLPGGGAGGQSTLHPSDLPRMALSLQGIQVGGEDQGSWSLETVPVEGGVALRDVQGVWRAMEIRGEGAWEDAGDDTRSRFRGEIRADDLARVSIALGFQPSLSSSRARALVDFAWPGWPPGMELKKVSGDVSLDVKDGRFVTESTRSQALRAFGLFNPATWQRRLKFDFSDLYRKGVAFDTLTGDLRLADGTVSTQNLLAKGPSAMFEIEGNTLLRNDAIDARLKVTLPLSSNLYVGCIAGLAACAGIVAFEQLWGERLEKLTTLAYDVRGTWQDPLVKELAGTTRQKGE